MPIKTPEQKEQESIRVKRKGDFKKEMKELGVDKLEVVKQKKSDTKTKRVDVDIALDEIAYTLEMCDGSVTRCCDVLNITDRWFYYLTKDNPRFTELRAKLNAQLKAKCEERMVTNDMIMQQYVIDFLYEHVYELGRFPSAAVAARFVGCSITSIEHWLCDPKYKAFRERFDEFRAYFISITENRLVEMSQDPTNKDTYKATVSLLFARGKSEGYTNTKQDAQQLEIKLSHDDVLDRMAAEVRKTEVEDPTRQV